EQGGTSWPLSDSLWSVCARPLGAFPSTLFKVSGSKVTYSKAVKLVCCEIEFQLDAKLISFRSSNFDQDTVTNADKLQSLNENSDFQSFHPRKTLPESTTVFKWLLDYKDTTTYSTERSEHFKPCRDKDLAYCLNDGECFVIETLTGSHKHCRRIILIAGERTDGRNS
ncbi:hypothetical protein JEQ12_013025, partial [Ovis aries]